MNTEDFMATVKTVNEYLSERDYSKPCYVYELTCDVWHGFTRPKGEKVSLISGENKNTLDEHGCGNFWVIDEKGNKMNVWACELTLSF